MKNPDKKDTEVKAVSTETLLKISEEIIKKNIKAYEELAK